MAWADALVAPRPIEPTIAKPAIESLVTPAVILQLLCFLLRPREKPAARMVVPGSEQVCIGHFVVIWLAHRDAEQTDSARAHRAASRGRAAACRTSSGKRPARSPLIL